MPECPPTQTGGTQEAPPGLPWADEWRGLGDRGLRGHTAAPPRKREAAGAAVRASKWAPGPRARGFVGFGRWPPGRCREAAWLCRTRLTWDFSWQSAGGRLQHPASGESPSSRRLPGLGAAAAGSEGSPRLSPAPPAVRAAAPGQGPREPGGGGPLRPGLTPPKPPSAPRRGAVDLRPWILPPNPHRTAGSLGSPRGGKREFPALSKWNQKSDWLLPQRLCLWGQF